MPDSLPDDDAILHTLSAAPPEQWGSMLQALGASVHPVGERQMQDEASGACTVSSLLGILESTAMSGSAASSTPPKEVGQASKSLRARAKRRPVAAPVSTTAEEDGRDIEELLRDLGEVCPPEQKKASKSSQKKTGKTSKAKSKPSPPVRIADCRRTETSEDEANSEDEEEGGKAEDHGDQAECDIHQDATEKERKPALMHSLSEGSLPKACQGPQCEQVAQEPTMPYRAPSFYFSRPSVATWSTPRPSPVQSTPASNPLSEANMVLSSSSSCSAEVTPEVPQQLPAIAWCQPSPVCQWSARPSVGTWLVRPVTLPCAMTQPEAGSQPQSSGQHGSPLEVQKEETQAWPATPTSTAPSSPRCHNNDCVINCGGNCGAGVVWVPVPVQLFDKVQRLISEEMGNIQ